MKPSESPGTNADTSRLSGLSVPPSVPTAGPTDREAVSRVLGGEQEVFRVLIERYQGKVYGMAMGYLGGDRERAADAAQEVFLKIFRGLRGFNDKALFSTWLHRIAVNHFISEIRKDRALKRGRPFSLDAPLRDKKSEEFSAQIGTEVEEPLRRLQNEEKGASILKAIEELDEDLRTIVVLRDIQDASYEEIAETLSIPVGTVRSRLHRARGLLREKLKGFLG